MADGKLEYIDAAQIQEILSPKATVEALEHAVKTYIDPEDDSKRLFSDLPPDGEFLIMPTVAGPYAGVKSLAMAPNNPQRGLPKIQGVYILYDRDTKATLALMDGTELTLLRTPGTTVMAIKALLNADPRGPVSAVENTVVIGSGPQAEHHIRMLSQFVDMGQISLVGRREAPVNAMVEKFTAEGLNIRAGQTSDVADAQLVITVTSSQTPVFDGSLVQDNAVVASVGSHGLDAHELEPELVLRSDVICEGRGSTYREGGNLMKARSEAEWREIHPLNVAEAVRDGVKRTLGKPAIYSGVGMAWEDIVIAAAVYEAHKAK